MRRCRAASPARRRRTLTFMVGGGDRAFARAKPVLEAMGKIIVQAGAAGSGQAAKICNNMILGISMIAVCEAFGLAEKLGLEPQKLFEIASQSSGQCWSLTSYCPMPGPGADLAGQPRLSAGLHRRDDAEGSEARARRRAPHARHHAARCRRSRGLSTLRRETAAQPRIFPVSSASCAEPERVNDFRGGFSPPPNCGDRARNREVPRPNRQYSCPLRKMIVNGTLRRYLDTSVQLTIDRGK